MKDAADTRKLTYIYLAATLLAITLTTQLGSLFNIIPIVLLGVISPLLLAIAFSFYEGRWAAVKSFLGHPQGFQFNVLAFCLALFLPFALMIFSIALDTGKWVLPAFSIMPGKLPILLILMTGEEYGWRRYAFARLSSHYSFMMSALLVSVIWLFWHYPGHLVGMGTPDELSFGLFALMLVPASLLIAYLYHWTKNVYLVILAHVSSNMAFNTLPFLPEITGNNTAFLIYSGLLWLLALPLLLNKKLWCR
ncbi:CPBP family glutamic-type intramembrane protease [Aliiglaciecola sp. CAU 1673]|uniref:CPBP family intramembrane glutamic endopeptidase n=1 Tax=Aliiglaciecola sp. CAU 1673 TaxID=3032595 RepID=UPI0023DA1FF1|nr:CPBP family intramembrane glutamic endopeptidase [Aliiglaciecola sp. CAU 1673]MDF2177945.1 CPBP family glutamic-type intramembrane protease [Aliiglaciecola sp. CAU 1673]